MTDETKDIIVTTIAFRREKFERWDPFEVMPIPAEFLPFLGHIAISWGSFEANLGALIRALIKADNTKPAPNLRRLNFDQRSALCIDLLEKNLSRCPTVTAFVRTILADANRISANRNVLLHGSVRMSLGTSAEIGPLVRIIAEGTQRGKPVTLTLDFDGVEDMFFEIGHLSARVRLLSAGNLERHCTSQEISELRDFLHANLENPATNGVR